MEAVNLTLPELLLKIYQESAYRWVLITVTVVISSWETYGKREIYLFSSRRNGSFLIVMGSGIRVRFCLRDNNFSFYFSYIKKKQRKSDKGGKYSRELFPRKAVKRELREIIPARVSLQHTHNQQGPQTPNVTRADSKCLQKELSY